MNYEEVMKQILKNWPSIAILFAGIVASYATYIASRRADKEQEILKTLTQEVKNIGQHNSDLTDK